MTNLYCLWNKYILYINTYTFAHTITASPKIAPFDFGEKPLNFGETASVQCTILGGDLPIAVKWLLNNIVIENDQYDENLSISKIGKRVTVLTIESVNGYHAGNYTCKAENKAGITSYSANLIVNG